MNSRFNLGDDDDDEISLKYSLGSKVNHNAALRQTPVFSYEYLSLGSTNFCFNYSKLNVREFISYFTQVKKLSKWTINDLIDHGRKEDHFHKVEIQSNKTIRDLIVKTFGKDRINFQDFPMVFQFALYTSDSEEINGEIVFMGESPRVFCFIGNYGVLHILYLDFEHQIYKRKF